MLFATPTITDAEAAVIAEIEDRRHQLHHFLREPRRWSGLLRRVTMARNTQGSNSIEGINADVDDVMAAASDEEPLTADQETIRALRGYSEAMTYALQLAGDEDFAYDARLLRSLHFMMTSYDLGARPGAWRIGPIYVQDADGGTVYEGPAIDSVRSLVAELVDELNRPDSTPVVARAAMAHLNLVMIHPFRDGNGRMARCLQTLVLAREGLTDPVFASIEEYLGRNTPAYYRVLGEVGRGEWSPGNDARPWLRFCLTAHLRQAETFLHRVRESETLWEAFDQLTATRGLPPRTSAALWAATQGWRIRNATYRSFLRDDGEEIADNTAGRDLGRLVDAGLLEPRGEKRGRHYVAAPELRSLRQQIRDARPRTPIDPFPA